MVENRRFSKAVLVRLTPQVKDAVNEAAHRRGSKPTHYAREAILAALRADKIDPAAVRPLAA